MSFAGGENSHIHFHSTWDTPTQLEILMCGNEQKPKLDPEPWKKKVP